MSRLIDDIMNDYFTCAGGFRRDEDDVYKVYLAKDIELVNIKTLLRRVKDAYRVLVVKSRAYHFYEDTK